MADPAAILKLYEAIMDPLNMSSPPDKSVAKVQELIEDALDVAWDEGYQYGKRN